MTEFEVVSGRKDRVDLVLIYRHEVIFRSAIWIRKKFILHQNKIYWTRVTEIGIFTETSNGEHNAFTKLKRNCIILFILLHEKFLQFDWLRAVVFQLNLKYLHVKITNLLRVVV